MMTKRELIVGTMNASKSAQLIMNAYNLERQGKRVLAFKPIADTKNGKFIVSRALEEKKWAVIVGEEETHIIENWINFEKPDVIMADELQFFTAEQAEEFARISLKYDIDVYLYGLLISYTGHMFEATKRAIECGFIMKTIEMECDTCRSPATHHTLHLDGVMQLNGSGISVEDLSNKEQVYKSVCFPCYIEEKHKHKE